MRILLSLVFCVCHTMILTAQHTGQWQTNALDLPQYHYTGPISYAQIADGSLPNDPWFILGNYRMTVFAHASGAYEMMTGERAWAKINHRNVRQGGNGARLIVGDSPHDLTGTNSQAAHDAEKIFGTGFASYTYKLDGIICERVLAVIPSKKVNMGTPALLIKVSLSNETSRRQSVQYTEFVFVNFREHRLQATPENKLPVSFNPSLKSHQESLITFGFDVEADDQHLLQRRKEQASHFDIFPPDVFMAGCEHVTCGFSITDEGFTQMEGSYAAILDPGQTAIIYVIVGLSYEEQGDDAQVIKERMLETAKEAGDGIPYLNLWKQQLPAFSFEPSQVLRHEMVWNAYTLEAMATFSSYYHQTYIPQGTAYEFSQGSIAGPRDHLQHTLPLSYYNPELAASALSYVMQKMRPSGEIPFIEFGFGVTSNGHWHTSDQQLFLFLTLSEYLRISEDYGFLTRKLPLSSPECLEKVSVYDLVEKAFIFFRNQIGTGINGLPKLWNSDWNDQMYAELPLRGHFHNASSHLNASISIVALKNLADQIEVAKQHGIDLPESSPALIASIHGVRNNILDAFISDLGDREFSRRAYMRNDYPVGEDHMFLAPHGYLLQIPEFPVDRKQALVGTIEQRLMHNEVMGARQSEVAYNTIQKAGEGENAGFWYALYGPVVAGVSTFDKHLAAEMLNGMLRENYARHYPDYWIGHWSGGDNVNSSLSDMPGLVNSTQKALVAFPVFCGHAHAWPLYCYLLINENRIRE